MGCVRALASCKKILAACIIDAKQLKADKNRYLHGNTLLYVNCLIFINKVKTDCESSLRQVRQTLQQNYAFY